MNCSERLAQAARAAVLGAAGASIWAAAAGSAFAALGDDVSSISREAHRMNAARRAVTGPLFTVHEMRLPDGSSVRQFVAGDGTVFAVRWTTFFKPDLSTLLGTSYPAYATAVRQRAPHAGIERQFRHEGLDLVVHSTAHLHVHSGFALRRSLLPAGVTPAQVSAS